MSKPETITIDEVKYIRADSVSSVPQLAPIICQDNVVAPWIIGKIYLIRTVTMIDTGILVAATDKELVLEEAAWVADTGRFSDAIAKAEFNEVEPFPQGRVILNRSCVIDAVEITKVQRSKK
jgi:hypothetical protein